MIVECRTNRRADLSPEMQAMGSESLLPLTIGKRYRVCAITCYMQHLMYYVHDDHELWYPVWRCASMFAVVDPSVDPRWRVRPSEGPASGPGILDPKGSGFLFAYPEWVNDRGFYGRLVDRDPEAIAVHSSYFPTDVANEGRGG